MKQTSWPAAPLRMPPGVKRTPRALEPRDGRGQIVDPETDVVQRRIVDLRPLLRIERLHQVDLDAERARARARDVLVHVLATRCGSCPRRAGRAGRPRAGAARALSGPPTAICWTPRIVKGRSGIGSPPWSGAPRELTAAARGRARAGSARCCPCGWPRAAASWRAAKRAREAPLDGLRLGAVEQLDRSVAAGPQQLGQRRSTASSSASSCARSVVADAGELRRRVAEQHVGRAARARREALRSSRVARDRPCNAITFADSESAGRSRARSTPTTRPSGPPLRRPPGASRPASSRGRPRARPRREQPACALDLGQLVGRARAEALALGALVEAVLARTVAGRRTGPEALTASARVHGRRAPGSARRGGRGRRRARRAGPSRRRRARPRGSAS